MNALAYYINGEEKKFYNLDNRVPQGPGSWYLIPKIGAWFVTTMSPSVLVIHQRDGKTHVSPNSLKLV